MRAVSCQSVLSKFATRLGLGKFKREENGTTAIEFGMVSVPFFMLLFALVGFAMYFWTTNSLDKGMDQTSRLVRTGEAQKTNMTVTDFKTKLCAAAGDWIKCNKVQVFVQKFPDWNSVQPQACLDGNGAVVTNTASGGDQIAQYSGGSSDIVIVTTCYKWEFTQSIPFLNLGQMSDKSMMLQAATAFQIEPYTPTP